MVFGIWAYQTHMYTTGKLLFQKNSPLFTISDDIVSIPCLDDLCQFSLKVLIAVSLKKVFQMYCFLMSYKYFLCSMQERAVKQFITKYFSSMFGFTCVGQV